MKPDYRNALGLALERGVAGTPTGQQRWLFLNAQPVPDIGSEWISALVCEQGFRPDYLKLKSAGYSVVPRFSNERKHFDGAIVLLGRNRNLNEYRITSVWNSMPIGGRLIVAGNKTDGIASIRNWFGKHQTITDSFSKFHAVVFWSDKSNDTLLPEVDLETMSDGFKLASGMFSAKGPDLGSQLLCEHFSSRISGDVADLGAGWGYLSASLLNVADNISRLDFFEADFESLRAAKENLGFELTEIAFHWIDVTTEFPKKPYDWVIMNPPFHDGRAANPELGKRFIEVAASTLVSGGRLLMVANQNLPYEKTLDKAFRRHEALCVKNGFKVIEAVR